MTVSDVTHRPRLYSNKRKTSESKFSSEIHSKSGSGDASTNQTKNNPEKTALKLQKQTQKAERENLVLWRSPLKTPYYFLLETIQLLSHYTFQLLTDRKSMATIMSFALVYFGTKQISSLEGTVTSLEEQTVRGLYWVLLGVASSVGLGTGLHTFLLYLGPHIAKVTMAAYECGTTDFVEAVYPKEMVCPEEVGTMVVTIFTIMAKVRFEAFMWGAGTALGELPPYFMARAARLAGQQDEEEDEDDEFAAEMKEALEKADTTTMLGKGKQFMHDLVNKAGFFGILLAASIPNPLFDLAGITCGHFLIPFWTFFGATLIGKAVVKMHIQMCFIIFLFSKHHIQNVVSFLPEDLQVKFMEFLDKQSAKFHNPEQAAKEQDEAGQNFLKQGFEGFVLCMVVYFVVSIVNSMAQSQMKKRQNKSK